MTNQYFAEFSGLIISEIAHLHWLFFIDRQKKTDTLKQLHNVLVTQVPVIMSKKVNEQTEHGLGICRQQYQVERDVYR